jgi:hypothetical protein
MILSVQAGRSLPLFLIRLILCASLLPVSAAQTIPFENNYRPGLLIPLRKQWEGPVSLRLTPVDGGRTGTVWFRETDAGILIFGRFSGPAPTWARSFDEMNSRKSLGAINSDSKLARRTPSEPAPETAPHGKLDSRNIESRWPVCSGGFGA